MRNWLIYGSNLLIQLFLVAHVTFQRGDRTREPHDAPPPTFCFIKATTPVRQTQLSNPRSATGGFQVSRAREGSR